MNSQQLTTTDLMTAEQISETVGISKVAVLKKRGLDDFFAGYFPNPSGTGRPVKMYKAEALSLWGHTAEQIGQTVKKLERKRRNDKGGVRWATEEVLNTALQITKGLYINNAQPNLKYACETAAKKMSKVPGYEHVTGQRLYRRLQRNEKNGGFRSEFFTENWEAIRMKRFKAKDHALESTGSLRYNNFQILENAGVAGEGYGACQVIVIDDFKRDAWTIKGDKLEMPEGIAYLDGLTGYPLLLLPTKSITTEAVAAGMVMVAYAYSLPENAIWVMENSKAMKNVAIKKLVESMYTDKELHDFENGNIQWVKEVFYGQTGPVVRNIPHIPRHPFKAKIERFFKIIKTEFDAVRAPLAYQGGSRQEATQLSLAAMPMAVGQETNNLPPSFYTMEYSEYWEELYKWLYSDCIMTPRPGMFQEWANEKKLQTGENINPTINDAWNYYRNHDYKREIDIERIAYLLYWAQPERHHPKNLWTVKKTLFISPTLNGKLLNLFSEKIDHTLIKSRLATVPIPNVPDKYLIFIADDPERPQLLDVAKEATMKDSKQVYVMRKEVVAARKKINETLDNGAKRLEVWDNQHELGSKPEEAPEWAKSLMPGYTPGLDVAKEATKKLQGKQEVEIAEDMSDELSDLDNLLNQMED